MTWRGVLVFLAALVMACVVSTPVRRVVWLGLRGLGAGLLALLAVVVERRRNAGSARRREQPVAPGPVVWTAVLYVTHHGQRPRVLIRGAVPDPPAGQWRTPVEVETAILRQYVEMYGTPADGGRLACRAKAVPGVAA